MRYLLVIFILANATGSALADMNAYKQCRKMYDPEDHIATAAILYGMFSGGFLGFLGGSATKKRIADQILKQCWPLLSPEEQEEFRNEAKSEIESMKWEKKPK